MIDKLEVGKKYVDKAGFIVKIILSEYDCYIGHRYIQGHNGSNEIYIYKEDGTPQDRPRIKSLYLQQEHKELKTVSGWLIIAPNGGIITDNYTTQHGLTTNIPFITKEDAIKEAKSLENFTEFKIIHLDNIESEEVE